MSSSSRLSLFLLSIYIFTSYASSDFAFIVSESAANEIGAFAVRESIHLITSHPIILNIQTQLDPLIISSLASIDITNHLIYTNLSFEFDNNTIIVHVGRVAIRTRANITAQLWPMTFGEEIIAIDMNANDIRFQFEIKTITARRHIQLKQCELNESPMLLASARNYWIVDRSIAVAASFAQSYLADLMCSTIASAVNRADTHLMGVIPLTSLIAMKALPEQLLDVELRYELVSIAVDDDRMIAQVHIDWQRNHDEAFDRGL